MRYPAQYPPLEVPIPDYVGLKKYPEQLATAEATKAPFKETLETLNVQEKETRQRSELDEERRKAEEYRQVLSGGADLMYNFSDEIAQKYPEFGKQLRAQVDGYAPLFKDPKLGREGVQDLITDFYKNALDRMNQLDKSSKDDPLLALKNRKLEAQIETEKLRAFLARLRGKNLKRAGVSAEALAKAWEIADDEETEASDQLEILLNQSTGTHSPRWEESVQLLQQKILKAQTAKQRVLLSVKGDEFFDFKPEAAPTPPDGKKEKKDPLGLRK